MSRSNSPCSAEVCRPETAAARTVTVALDAVMRAAVPQVATGPNVRTASRASSTSPARSAVQRGRRRKALDANRATFAKPAPALRDSARPIVGGSGAVRLTSDVPNSPMAASASQPAARLTTAHRLPSVTQASPKAPRAIGVAKATLGMHVPKTGSASQDTATADAAEPPAEMRLIAAVESAASQSAQRTSARRSRSRWGPRANATMRVLKAPHVTRGVVFRAVPWAARVARSATTTNVVPPVLKPKIADPGAGAWLATPTDHSASSVVPLRPANPAKAPPCAGLYSALMTAVCRVVTPVDPMKRASRRPPARGASRKGPSPSVPRAAPTGAAPRGCASELVVVRRARRRPALRTPAANSSSAWPAASEPAA